MLEIRDDTIYKPLELIFKQALTTSVSPSVWNEAILSLVKKWRQKKSHFLAHYRTVSLLSICGKFF